MECLECFESRLLFAVTLTEVSPGDFSVDGDSGNNSFTLTVDADGDISVTGPGGLNLSDTGAATVTVNTADGSDSVIVYLADPILATVFLSSGNDYAALHGLNDEVFYEAEVYGGSGNDSLALEDGSGCLLVGEAGLDSIYFSLAADNNFGYGGADDDFLSAVDGAQGNRLYGQGGNDVFDTEFDAAGSNVILGGDGNDKYYSSFGFVDSFDGGSGFDEVFYKTGETNPDILTSVEAIGSY